MATVTEQYDVKTGTTTRYLDDAAVMQELDRLFPQMVITPNSTKDEIMFNAGQRSIIDFINAKLEQKTKARK